MTRVDERDDAPETMQRATADIPLGSAPTLVFGAKLVLDRAGDNLPSRYRMVGRPAVYSSQTCLPPLPPASERIHRSCSFAGALGVKRCPTHRRGPATRATWYSLMPAGEGTGVSDETNRVGACEGGTSPYAARRRDDAISAVFTGAAKRGHVRIPQRAMRLSGN
jgi:hypothetical protein